jgi:Glyoxalase-like domain
MKPEGGMAFEIDHIFICVDVGAPEAERLIAFGLTEGKPNTHPGQGTACRRFFFGNAYLELLWVHSPAEAQAEQTRRTRLWERWSGRRDRTCPFGICVRPTVTQRGELPFATWDYCPPYFPPGVSLGIGANSEAMAEPMLCYLQSGQRPDRYAPVRQQPVKHPARLREITRVRFVGPEAGDPSSELQATVNANLVELVAGDKPCVELAFDGEQQAKHVDFWPTLPLIFRW